MNSPRGQTQVLRSAYCLPRWLPAWLAMTAVVATTIAAAAATITTKASASTAKAASAASAPIFARFGFVDFQSAAVNFLTIELINCRCGFFVAGHFDEPEASRTSSV